MNWLYLSVPRAALISAIATCHVVASEPIRFIPATPDNTTMSDGSTVNTKEGEGDWKWLPNEGNQGIFESYGDPKRNANPLVIIVDGLKAGTDYEVFGYFWVHGFGEEKAAYGKNEEPHHWPARFGVGLASLTTYGGRFSPFIPWIISPGAKTSRQLGVSATLEEASPLVVTGPPLKTANSDIRLVRALVGISRADKSGQLPVFMDDFPDSIHCGRTRIDGIGVRPAPTGSKPSAGAGDSKALHFALRAGDRLSAERELEAGADVNALDAQGIVPLFHPVSIGDQQGVRYLLSKGADPNRRGQSISVLTAATTIADVGMTRLLIKAGAEIPSGRVESTPRVNQNIDVSHLHPAIAAIRAGSLATLKVLLEKTPDLDLESLGPPQDSIPIERATSWYLVEDAMAMGHDELAAFLIDRGCTLQTKIFRSVPNHPHSGLLVRSITEGKAFIRSKEAIYRRGVPVIIPAHAPHWWQQELMPWDGLSAAVAVGDRELTSQLLPHAKAMDATYQELILSLARWSGDPVILSLLLDVFPGKDGQIVTEQPSVPHVDKGEELRLLLPRVVPQGRRAATDQHNWTLAVLPSPDVEGEASVLEVSASKESNWKVVDRQHVREALAESRFLNPWGKGEHRLAELGDVIAADLLILVSKLSGSETELLRFEAVDVSTGLPVFREHIERKTFSPEKVVEPLLARIRAAFNKARAGKRPKAVMMLPFIAGSEIPNASAVSRILGAAIQSEVDAVPGLLSVGKDQFQAIANEQKLGDAQGMWAAAVTLEGGVALAGNGKISLTLRLSPLTGGKDAAIDVTETGESAQIPVLANRAWKRLISSPLLGEGNSPTTRPDARQSAAEAARLLREGEWLVNSGFIAEAIPILERASLLGADPPQLVGVHLNALANMIPLSNGNIPLSKPSSFIKEHPPTLQFQQNICHNLDGARAMLDQASYYLALYGTESLKWTGPEFQKSERGDFLHAVTILSYIRASIPKVLPPGITPETVEAFGKDLDCFTSEYFRIRAAMDKPTISPRHGDIFYHGVGSAAMMRRNPELLKGWVTMFFLSKSSFRELFREKIPGVSNWYGMTRLLAEAVEGHLGEYDGNLLEYRKAELEYVFATDDRRSACMRNLLLMPRLGRQERQGSSAWLVGHGMDRHMPSALQDTSPLGLLHDEAIIAALIHEPNGSTDWMRYAAYSHVNTLISLENKTLSEARQYLRINNPSDDYMQRAASLSKETEGWTKIERLLQGALLWERIYGRSLHDELSSQMRKLYQPEKNSVRSSLNARLLVDLRQIDHFSPGMFKLPVIDRVERNRMWLYYHPFEKEPFVEKDGEFSFPYPRLRQPWIIGIDCTGGKLEVAVNLSQAPGLGPGPKAEILLGGCEADTGFIEQTDEHILTDVTWNIAKPSENPAKTSGVLIEKRTGKMIALDQTVMVGPPADLVRSTARSSGVCSIGEDFYAMQQVGDPDAFYSTSDEIPFQVVRIKTNGKVHPITAYGRRPQMTPFDPADRSPKMILRDGKRLLVLHSWDYMGHYNPADESWDMDQRRAPLRYSSARKLVDDDFNAHILPPHRLEGGGKTRRLVIDSKRTSSGMLAIQGKGADGNIKVDLQIPENFLSQPIYGDSVMSNGNTGRLVGYGTYEKRRKENAYHIVVLNQTEDELILGLQIGPGFQWHPGARTGLFLPLLWALQKSDLFHHLELPPTN